MLGRPGSLLPLGGPGNLSKGETMGDPFTREYLGSPASAHQVGRPEQSGIEIIIHDPPVHTMSVPELAARLHALRPSLIRVDAGGHGGLLLADLRNRGLAAVPLEKRSVRAATNRLPAALDERPLLAALATKIEESDRYGQRLARVTFDGPALPEKQVCEFDVAANAEDGFRSALEECEKAVAAAMKRAGYGGGLG